jgi:Uma2 family endonuclease
MTALAVPPGYRPIDPYEDAPPDVSFEVVNGVRVEKTMSFYEQFIGNYLHEVLAPFCRANGLGWAVSDSTFRMPGSRNDRRPDVAFVSFARWPRERGIPRARAIAVAPDLAVEVVSPTDVMFDVIEKLHEYFRCGVRQVWLVLSHVEQVYVYTSPAAVRILSRGDTVTDGDLLPGFAVPVGDLFPPAEEEPTKAG